MDRHIVASYNCTPPPPEPYQVRSKISILICSSTVCGKARGSIYPSVKLPEY
jgi:hypothetical protein